MPQDVLDEFTYGGRVKLVGLYFDEDNVKSKDKIIWKKEDVEKLRVDFRNGVLQGNYGIKETNKISRHIDEHMLSQVNGIKIVFPKPYDDYNIFYFFYKNRYIIYIGL